MDKKDLLIDKIRKIYPDNNEEVLIAISNHRKLSFRLVLTNPDRESLFEQLQTKLDIKKGPFTNSYFLESNDTAFLDIPGIYIQGFASMIPAVILNAVPGYEVLDLCAAPGSKSSQLAGMFSDEIHITCVDNNSARLFALKDNLEKQYIHNFEILKANASTLQYLPQYTSRFDAVMVDVPCSNEGNIRLNDEKSINKWNPKLAKKISQLQKKILSSGIKALKTGGRLVYSTCTYSVEENEEVVDWALKNFPNMHLESIRLDIPNRLNGITTYGKKTYNPEITKCVRILPTDLFDGFFVASLLKL